MQPKPRLIVLLSLISLIVLGLTVVDLIRDPGVFDPAEVALDLLDSLVLVGAMATVAWTVQGVRDLRETQEALSNNLARTMARGDIWRHARHAEIDALGKAIEAQFKA